MTNVQCRKLYEGEWVSSQVLASGEMLKRPIYSQYWRNGSHMSLDDARQLVRELSRAIEEVEAEQRLHVL